MQKCQKLEFPRCCLKSAPKVCHCRLQSYNAQVYIIKKHMHSYYSTPKITIGLDAHLQWY